MAGESRQLLLSAPPARKPANSNGQLRGIAGAEPHDVRARTFRDLTVWNTSVELVVLLYRVTDRFPNTEVYGLVSQIRRAADSVPANIAEGNSRPSTAAYLNHINVALGSHGELRALVEIALRLGFIDRTVEAQIGTQLDEVGRLLSGLRTALKERCRSRSLIPDP